MVQSDRSGIYEACVLVFEVRIDSCLGLIILSKTIDYEVCLYAYKAMFWNSFYIPLLMIIIYSVFHFLCFLFA